MPQLLLKVKFVKKLKLCFRALSFLSYSFFESFTGRNSNILKFTLTDSAFFSLSSHRAMKPLPLSNSRALTPLQREALSPLAGTPFSPWAPQFLATTHLFSFSVGLPVLDILYGILFLAFFMQHVFKVHPFCSMC